jgi:putative acetyltransferase
MSTDNPSVRRASVSDCDLIAAAHVESIRSLAAKYYDQETIEDWARPRTGQTYRLAMESGEAFFVAVAAGPGGADHVVGFSSYRVTDGKHRTAIYVCSDFARRKIGTALFRAAENAARSNGARELQVAASLCAVAFYKANGFEKLEDGEHTLAQEEKCRAFTCEKNCEDTRPGPK